MASLGLIKTNVLEKDASWVLVRLYCTDFYPWNAKIIFKQRCPVYEMDRCIFVISYL